MKFNCGLSDEEKRDIKAAKITAEFNVITEWHKKFAWFPIRVGSGDCRWLEYVERRTEPQYYFDDADLWVSEWKTVNYPKWKYRKIDLNNA